jgi:hypothetical protein
MRVALAFLGETCGCYAILAGDRNRPGVTPTSRLKWWENWLWCENPARRGVEHAQSFRVRATLNTSLPDAPASLREGSASCSHPNRLRQSPELPRCLGTSRPIDKGPPLTSQVFFVAL